MRKIIVLMALGAGLLHASTAAAQAPYGAAVTAPPAHLPTSPDLKIQTLPPGYLNGAHAVPSAPQAKRPKPAAAARAAKPAPAPRAATPSAP